MQFKDLYKATKTRLFNLAQNYLVNEMAAEDVVQETFVELYRNLQDIPQGNEEYWLLTTMKNKALNDVRKTQREILLDHEEIENLPESFELSTEERVMADEQQRETRTLQKEVMEELLVVNASWHQAIVLTYREGKAQKDVAKEMKVTIEVLHSTLYRAKKWIQSKYDEDYETVKN